MTKEEFVVLQEMRPSGSGIGLDSRKNPGRTILFYFYSFHTSAAHAPAIGQTVDGDHYA